MCIRDRYDDSADEYNGEELLLYAKEIDKAVKAYTDNGTEDLMKYFYESDYVCLLYTSI